MITMFSPSASTQDLNRSSCNIPEPEDVEPWKSVFVNSLRKVLDQVHPTLTAREDALDYVEKLIIQLLGMLCQKPSPHSIADVEERVRTTFPTPIDKWALDDAREALEKYKKRSDQPVLPVERIHQMLQKEVLQYKLDLQVIVFIAAVLEYISADLFKLTGNYVKNIHHAEITCQDIRVAMCADKVLADMFTHHSSTESVNENESPLENSSYESAVKDFIHDEKQHLRNLNMISKVFLEKINNVLPINEVEALQNMFQNLSDITDLTFTIIASLEEIVEMNEDKQPPLVGSFLEELAEDEEFEVYSRFSSDIIEMKIPDLIVDLLSENNRLDVLASAGHGFREAVKYYLPNLLRYPIWHCSAYFDYIRIFQEVSESETDKDDLKQLEGLLKPLENKMNILLNKFPKTEKEYGSRLRGKKNLDMLMGKVDEMKKTVDGFASKYDKAYYTEFLREDTLNVKSSSKRMAERRATLFDGVLVLSKRKRSSSASGQAASGLPVEYKLKDLIYTRKVEIKDRDDTEEIKNAFEIVPREQPPLTCMVKSYDEKCLWMSDLVMLNIKCMLDRSLNSVLEDIEKKNPLKMPPVEMYRFAEPDSDQNIIFEGTTGTTIKGGTLLKLVERLTYHVYTDGIFIHTFLSTYKTFISGQGLLELLIERYHVPEALTAFNIQNTNTLTPKMKEDIKRYRKNYYQPIQARVLNVLKKWVDSYFYDLENDVELINKINDFLDSIKGKSMKKWIVCIKDILQRKKDTTDSSMVFAYDGNPPTIEWHIIDPEKDSEMAWKEWNSCSDIDDPLCVGWKLLVLHPVEIARQLTLIEYEMYKAVRSSELIGAAWTKDNKDEFAPHVTKIMRSTTYFTLWLEKTIVETENLEERVAIMTRLLEIMNVLLDLNNYNGVFSIFSALQSACVYRLSFTIAKCPKGWEKRWREVEELYGNHYKKYIERLHSITPPCVPFFGVFLTKLMHAEEGNADFLNDKEGIINFSKRKFVTDIIQDIQRFQDKPYCLNVEPTIKEFLESMLFQYPFDKPESEALNDLYKKSLKIEPKEHKETKNKPLVAPRKWSDLNLKKLRNASQSYRFGISSNPKGTNDDIISQFMFSPGGCIVNGPGRKNRFNISTNTLISNSSGPISPCKDLSVFSPIFFGNDLPPGAAENTHTSSSYHTEEIGEGPPLPPRVTISSPIIPPRDISPPPLPPRRDSLHFRQSSTDSSISSFSQSPLSSTLSHSFSSDSSNIERPHFDFPSSYHFDLEPEHSSDLFSLLPKHTADLMEFDDTISNQNCNFDMSDQKSPPPFLSQSQVSATSTGPEWNGFPKFNNVPEKCMRPLPKSIVIYKTVPSMFQFNVVPSESFVDSHCS